ncbi:MAG: helix-turn-helix domain-containing protein [Acidimicrobiales bacterium]
MAATAKRRSPPDPFLDAVRPVLEALGGELVTAKDAEPQDVPLVWQGDIVGAVRPPALHGALDRLLERVANELGAPLDQLTREGKQRAVELLDERGAFNFRKSVEDAAQALRVSRFTVYNYLSRISENRLSEDGKR